MNRNRRSRSFWLSVHGRGSRTGPGHSGIGTQLPISACYTTRMSPELLGILGVGVALAGLILASKRDTDRRMDALEARMGSLEQRMARVEGLLEGLGLAGRASEATTAAPAAGD